jgi:hypothetical protein
MQVKNGANPAPKAATMRVMVPIIMFMIMRVGVFVVMALVVIWDVIMRV